MIKFFRVYRHAPVNTLNNSVLWSDDKIQSDDTEKAGIVCASHQSAAVCKTGKAVRECPKRWDYYPTMGDFSISAGEQMKTLGHHPSLCHHPTSCRHLSRCRHAVTSCHSDRYAGVTINLEKINRNFY